MEIATLQARKKCCTRTHAQANEKFSFYLVKPSLRDSRTTKVRRGEKKTFLLFIGLTIRTIHNFCLFELNALKLHHERIAALLFAIHIFFSPIIISAFVWPLSLYLLCLTRSFFHSFTCSVGWLVDCFVYSGQPKIDVSRAN